MTPLDEAHSLLRKCAEDVRVFEKLASDPLILDETLGFHAQQAVEKACKAVLNAAGIRYPKTHDLSELLRVLDKQGIARPFEDEAIEFLTPYATMYRYEDSSDEPLDRQAAQALIQGVHSWAADYLKKA